MLISEAWRNLVNCVLCVRLKVDQNTIEEATISIKTLSRLGGLRLDGLAQRLEQQLVQPSICSDRTTRSPISWTAGLKIAAARI